jgi:endogenous inhibitor of DNA gyrase (YacG/DUF329 family)
MTQGACTICGKPQADPYRPFCSKRCADVDLSRWFGGKYAIPGRDPEEGSDPLLSDEDVLDAGHPATRRI